jgi:hypothetical protein
MFHIRRQSPVNNYDEGCSVYSGHYEADVVIERPIAQVWRQFLAIGSWVTSHTIENVYGSPDSVGSITRVSSSTARESGLPPPHYHYCKIIKLVPERQYLLKSYAEKGGSYGMQLITGFDDTRFIEIGNKTKLTFNIFAEMRGEAVVRNPAAIDLDASRDGMIRNLNNLKRIVEGR